MNKFSQKLLSSCFFSLAVWAAVIPPVSGEAMRVPVTLQDIALVDANSGRRMNLVSDVMGDKVVVLNFIFTACSMSCPLQSASLAQVQKLLGAKMGKQVVFVSVSLDPYSDTPARLREFANAHRAGAGWHFFTGDPRSIDELRQGFNAFDPRRDEHPPVIAIGRAQSSDWSRLYGLPEPAAIAAEIDAWLG